MELSNPVIQTLIGLVVFYIGLKMFSGGMKWEILTIFSGFLVTYLYVLVVLL